MKTLNFHVCLRIQLQRLRRGFLLGAAFCAGLAMAQQDPQNGADAEQSPVRPQISDSASLQLIRNYLTVTGGREKHDRLNHVVATGTLTEAGKSKNFELIETQDGKRHLTLSWRHLGRDYEELTVFDGSSTWKQKLKPKLGNPTSFSGQDSVHFANQRWLLQPFVLPAVASFALKYQGNGRVAGRTCHVVVGFGKKNVRSWFYFDQEKFLLLRWGGLGDFAGVSEYKDYRALAFKKVEGTLLPSAIDLIVDDKAYGRIDFDSIVANPGYDNGLFAKPIDRTPVLRQRRVESL